MMSSPTHLRFKTYILLFLVVTLGSFGNILLSKGMKQLGDLHLVSASAFGEGFIRTFSSAIIWSGILTLLLCFVAYLLVLSWADYSYVLPASAASYALIPLLGVTLLKETVSPVRWAGIILICLGVALVGRTPPRTKEHP